MSDAEPADASDSRLTLGLRTRVETFKGRGRWNEVTVEDSVAPSESALLICDMWDAHWCKTAMERAEDLAPRVDALAGVARRAGIQIIHSPSGTVRFYGGTSPRQAMATLPLVGLPEPLDIPDPDVPVDGSFCSCDAGDEYRNH